MVEAGDWVWPPTGRSGAALWLFVVNDNAAAATVHLSVDDLDPLGLSPGVTYAVTDVLAASARPSVTGASLQSSGLDVAVAALSSSVIRLASP